MAIKTVRLSLIFSLVLSLLSPAFTRTSYGAESLNLNVAGSPSSVSTAVYNNSTVTNVVYSNTIENPGFETGNLTGWEMIEGGAFGPNSVSDEKTYWAEGIPYQQEGNYHLNGWRYQETETGRLRSSVFTLGGSGWITYMLGGGRHTDQEYIEVSNADTHEVLARFGNTEWSDVNFPHPELGLRLANFVQYRADLSNYIGTNLYIDIVDQGISDWGLLFADSFNTYYENIPGVGVRADNLYDSAPKELENPGFETGDLSGWTVVEGDAFSPSSISSDTYYWNEQIPYNKEGIYHLDGWKNGEANAEAKTGRLRSSAFKLSGTGWITFKLGGGKNTNLVHINIHDADTGELLARYGNTEFADVNFPHVDQGLRLANLVQYKANLSAFIGTNLYVEIVDNATSDWGLIFVDAIHTYLASVPIDGVPAKNLYNPLTYEVRNPGFEKGNLTGWSIISGDAFGPGSVSKDSTWWAEGIPFNQEGDYHLDGWRYAESKTGVLRSSSFTLGGAGWITFKLGGGKNTSLVHIDIYNANTDELIARYGNTEFKDINFPHIDQGMNLANMVQYRADLSKHIDENLYIEIVDNATSDWGTIFADAFFTYHPTVPTEGNLATNLYTVTPEELLNPGFETGDTSGWTVEGEAFANAVTSQAQNLSVHVPFGHTGTYHLGGFTKPDDQTGTISSSPFRLSGTGFVSFLVSGGNNPDNLFVALVRASDQTVLMKATGNQSDLYSRINWDATAYLGEVLYIQVFDQNQEAGGHINVDDFQVKGSGELGSWSFSEGQGRTAKDQVRNLNDTIHYVFNDAKYKLSSAPEWREGVIGKGLLFDGYSNWISRPSNQIAKPGDELTLEAWVAPRSYEWGDQGKLSAIVNQYDQTNNSGYILGMGRLGTWSFQAGINGKWTEVWANPNKPLPKFEWSYVTATYSKADGMLRLYLNGELVGETKAEKKLSISPAQTDFMIGKNNSGAIINGVFTANMFNGMIDEVKVYNKRLSASEIQAQYQTVKQTFTDGTLPKPNLDFDRSVYDGDRYRPQYHFIAPGHWMNEPHAPLYFNGQYHIFYQFNPQGPYWHQIHWGHAVSDDMVHWKDMPVAIAPTAGSETPDGVWSGGSIVDNEGNPALFFTAGNDSATPNQAVGLARSTFKDDGDNDLKNWVLNGTPVITQAPDLSAVEGEVWYGNFRDPYIWKDGDTWYQVVGSGIKNVGGTALLYTSTDLVHWTYKNPFFVGNYEKYHKTGQVWELPVFLPLGNDSNGTMKYVFLINPWFDHYDADNVKYVFYWVGTWDKVNNKFVPDKEEPSQFDFGEHFTGPSGMVDANGRTILFNIAQDRRSEQAHYDAGWAHNAGLPVVLTLRNDSELGVEPIEELNSLRIAQAVDAAQSSIAQANQSLSIVRGDMLEILLEANVGSAKKIGFTLRATADGQEQTQLYYDVDQQALSIDRMKSSLDPDIAKGIQSGEMELDGDLLKLHIYLDRSMIEAYANGKNSITTRVYPTRGDAMNVQLWSEGGEAQVQSLKVWMMNSAYGSSTPSYWPAVSQPNAKTGTLENHDFETGDLRGWITEGNAFTDKHITKTNDWGWGGPFNQASENGDPNRYHLWGFHPEYGEDATGSLKSKTFKLGGNGNINFLVGGGKEIDKLFVALVRASDNQILMKETGSDNEQYRRVSWDASSYIGQELYMEVVDNRTGGWGHINVDNINVPVALETPLPNDGYSYVNIEPSEGFNISNGNIKLTEKYLNKEVDAKGKVVAKIVIDEKTLTAAFDQMKQSASRKVTIEIPAQPSESVHVSLPLSTLHGAAREFVNGSVSILYGSVSYDLPLELLREAQFINATGRLQVVIELPKDSDLESMKSKSAESKLTILSDAFEFKVMLDNAGQLSEVKDFGNVYVSRSITLDATVDSSNTTAVMYDSPTGKINFVPATFEVKDGKTIVTMKRNGNSIYAIAQSKMSFIDIENHWAKKEIQLLASKQILKGQTDESFVPDDNITRAEFAALLVRGLGLTDPAEERHNLTDVHADDWFSGSVGAAVRAGIITGYEDHTFRPNQFVTREEMAVMISKTIQFAQNKGVNALDEQLLAKFIDGDQVSPWAQASLLEVLKAKIMVGSPDNTLHPVDHATRAEATVCIKRLLEFIGFIWTVKSLNI